jgi:uncharacterized protein (TIGR02466 family)
MSNSYIHKWFPKVVHVTEGLLPENEVPLLDAAVKNIFRKHGYSNNGMLHVKSLHKTYNSLNTEPEFQLLANSIMSKAKEFATILGYDNKVTESFYFKNMWSNISGEGDFNFPHVHGESLISGAYYIAAPAGCKIRFFSTVQNMMLAPSSLNELNFEYCDYACIQNNLLLFKSDFLHGNERQEGGEKIVVSFNIGVKNEVC